MERIITQYARSPTKKLACTTKSVCMEHTTYHTHADAEQKEDFL